MTGEGPWTIQHFSQSNPQGSGQGNVAALLRRVADTLDNYGAIAVQDLVFHSEITKGEPELTITVYFDTADAT